MQPAVAEVFALDGCGATVFSGIFIIPKKGPQKDGSGNPRVFRKTIRKQERMFYIMKLSEKITVCRRRLGLSQEELANRLGVSRQAVGKWENGSAVPETSKLLLLAQTLGVTADWLLSDDDDCGKNAAQADSPSAQAPTPDWIGTLPDTLQKLFRRWGWLIGVYLAVGGAGIAGIGALARCMSARMFSGFGMDSAQFSHFMQNNPVSILGGVMLAAGCILFAAGILLAVILKRRGKK